MPMKFGIEWYKRVVVFLRKLSLFLLILIILIFSACSKESDTIESLNKEIADLNSKVSVLTEENNKLKNELQQLDNQQKTESTDETINNTESSTPAPTITTTPTLTPSPSPLPTPNDAPATESDEKEIIVYITKTGTKYHRSECRHLSKSKTPIDLESAKEKYSPCSTCKPPS
jgi:septal ring-binding cell division protein DamX